MGNYTATNDPSAHFNIQVYTGTGNSGNAQTFDGSSNLQPDLLWNKVLSEADSHAMFDSTRGVNKIIYPNVDLAEGTDGNGNIESFDSNGFTVGGNQQYANRASATQCTWAWRAGGGSGNRTTFSESGNNPAGGYQANTTAGFSIVDYTGTGSAGTIAHGLGAVPKSIWVRNLDDGSGTDWGVYHRNASSAGNDSYLVLNDSDAASTAGTMWNDTTPTSSVFTVGSNNKTNKDGTRYIAYVFAEVRGFSKFGAYVGNNNSNGPFIYCGFKPAWVMVKHTSSAEDWALYDRKRNGRGINDSNPASKRIKPNTTAAQADDTFADFISTGFKIRNTGADKNSNSATYVYWAFADHPLVTNSGAPCPGF
jgi:hypothetical protein